MKHPLRLACISVLVACTANDKADDSGGAFDPGSQAADMAAFAPFAKFNCYNICYTTMGADKWVSPTEEYRQFVTDTTRAMKARGLDFAPLGFAHGDRTHTL